MKSLIFDLDGTLVESLPGIAASLNRALDLHGLPGHSHAAVRGFIGDGARMLVTRALAPGEAALHLESVLKSFGDDYAISWQNGTVPYEGIPELLADLKSRGIPLAVLSNKPHLFTVQIVERLFPPATFTTILGNREGMPHKPDPTGASSSPRHSEPPRKTASSSATPPWISIPRKTPAWNPSPSPGATTTGNGWQPRIASPEACRNSRAFYGSGTPSFQAAGSGVGKREKGFSNPSRRTGNGLAGVVRRVSKTLLHIVAGSAGCREPDEGEILWKQILELPKKSS